MATLPRSGLASGLLALALLLAGCAADGGKAAPAGEPALRVVTTSHGVFMVTPEGVTGYAAPGKEICQSCMKACETLRTTGKMDMNCPDCKAPRTVTNYYKSKG